MYIKERTVKRCCWRTFNTDTHYDYFLCGTSTEVGSSRFHLKSLVDVATVTKGGGACRNVVNAHCTVWRPMGTG